jgi:hypothetical protein
MVKPLNIRNLIKDINKELPLTEEEIRDRANENKRQSREMERKLRDSAEAELERTREKTGEPRRRKSAKLGKFAGRKTLAAKKRKNKKVDRAKAKKRDKQPKVRDQRLQTLLEVIEEVRSKEELSEDFVNTKPIVVDDTPPPTEILSAGRILRVVPSGAFGPDRSEYVRKSEPSENINFVADSLRGRTGNYWSIEKNRFDFLSDSSMVRRNRPYIMNFRDEVDVEESSDFGRTEQWVDIRANSKMFRTANNNYSKTFWQSYVSGTLYNGSSKKSSQDVLFAPTVRTNELYFDYVHEMPLPFSRKELDQLNSPLNALSADITPEYNFYIKTYEEKVTDDRGVLENTLPNMYVFLSQLNNENPNPEFEKFIELDGTLKVENGIFTRKEKRTPFDINEHPIGQYYDLYARQYDNAKSNGTINRLNAKFSNLLLAHDDATLIKDFNEKREMFPMYVDINFSTDKTTTFAQILKDSNLSNAFVSRVANRIINNEASSIDVQESTETIIQDDSNSNPRREVKFSSTQKRFWNISDILQNLLEAEEDLDPLNAVYLGEYENQIKSYSGPEFDFFKTLMFTIFFGKLQKLIAQKFRTFEEVMDGRPAYSETVMYRVAKFEGDENGPLLQNFYFPNSNEIDVMRFIDTQVKYDKQYTYVVYAYQMVVGNQYFYSDLDASSTDQHAIFKVTQEPSLVLMEHEFFKFTGAVLDDPPISPDIDVVPYKGIDDQLLILLNSNIGNFVTDPIAIKPEDNEFFDKLRKERKVEPDEPIRFKADDHVTTFEVYRLDFQPEKYEDFADNLQAIIKTDVNLRSLQSSTAGSFVDMIEPNKKYYYTFRSVDVHNNISNPSPIIRVEMINDQGTVFLLKDVVGFAEKEKMTSKPMRRYMQLVPSVLQTLINEEKSGFEDAESANELRSKIHLGVVDETLWGKKFRIRLVSKSTGKRVDFKVRFEHQHKEKA